MRNAQRNIHDNFAKKSHRMKMIIQSINNEKLLKKKDAKSNAKIYNSIINELFHIIHIFSNNSMLISMLKFIRALTYSNIFIIIIIINKVLKSCYN